MKKLLASLLLALGFVAGASASEAGMPWDKFPQEKMSDVAALQNGAKLFVNYCLNCHSASYMRYNRLRDLDLTEDQIKKNMLFATDKVGDVMKTSLDPKQAKEWFGAVPPDLSVIARSRGADWLYTYLRTFYRDPKTTNGWNNAVFPNAAMPHALWMLQGERRLEVADAGHGHVAYKWSELSKGAQSAPEYDATVRDLVNFLVYVGEPHAASRKAIGVITLFVLGVLFMLAYLLKKEYWKDVH